MQGSLFTLSTLSALLALLIALSVAAERLVEIIKGIPGIGPWLKTENPDANKEGVRQLLLHVLAVGAGILTAFLALEVLPTIPGTGVNGSKTSPGALLVLGLLASGGSGFWTAILGYVNHIKEIKKAEAIDTGVRVAANVLATAQGAGIAGATARTALALNNETAPGEAVDATVVSSAKSNLERLIKIANARL